MAAPLATFGEEFRKSADRHRALIVLKLVFALALMGGGYGVASAFGAGGWVSLAVGLWTYPAMKAIVVEPLFVQAVPRRRWLVGLLWGVLIGALFVYVVSLF